MFLYISYFHLYFAINKPIYSTTLIFLLTIESHYPSKANPAIPTEYFLIPPPQQIFMAQKKPLYFLTHEGQPYVFSGSILPFEEEKKSPLAGMLLLDRPSPCPAWYLERLSGTFGKVITAPMTMQGKGALCPWMKITDPFSLTF